MPITRWLLRRMNFLARFRETAGRPINSAEDYIAAMSASTEDIRTRTAFQDAALLLAKPGLSIFDFGAGPGTDAKFYLQHGFRVFTYDNDDRMTGYLARSCSAEIQSGMATAYAGSYAQFLSSHVDALRLHRPIDLVTCNFAPLNLIEDPHELFAALHTITGPEARILASVLNPWFVGDMSYRWWWQKRSTYHRVGEFCMHTRNGAVYRRSTQRFATIAAPYFRLATVLAGLPRSPGEPLRSAGSLACLTSRFLFLVFVRSQVSSEATGRLKNLLRPTEQ